MTMTASARAAAIVQAISQNPNYGKLSSAEKTSLLNQVQAVFGADLTYITTNATVLPTALVTPLGAAVSTAGSAVAQTGTVTSATNVTGTGTIT